MVVHICNLSIGNWRQEVHEREASLGYLMSSKPASVIQGDLISKKKKKAS
jgi:hypothetical protein